MASPEIFSQYRPLLFSIAYRMLGGVMEAEDMVQETFLRWCNAADTEVESPKSYLTAIVTRLCIDYLRLARVKREESIGSWLPEPLFSDPAQDVNGTIELNESLSLAFLFLMESLTPTERAVFLLREVFAYGYAEIADLLGRSEANCRQIFHRAKTALDGGNRRAPVSPEQQKRLFTQFLQASMDGDLQGLVSMLADDIVMYSDGGFARHPIYGAKNVASFMLGLRRKAPNSLEVVVSETNAQPALFIYTEGRLYGVMALNYGAGRITEVYFQLMREKLTTIPQYRR